MKKNQTLDRSLEWIRSHPNAANLDVPDTLVEKWIYDDDPDDTRPTGFYLTVFSFGYFQHELMKSDLPTGQMHKVASARLFECFAAWQMKLALAMIHRKTDLNVAPLPLFDFPADEQISYWPKTPSPLR